MPEFLCFNVGSSSLSFALFPSGASEPDWTGGIDLSVDDVVTLRINDREREVLDVPDPRDFPGVAAVALERAGRGTIAVHRIVHGGESAASAAWLDPTEIARLEGLTTFAPLHQPAGLAVVQRLAELQPDLRQIAVFDTAFHRTMPDVSRLIPVAPEGPFAGLRRFGFHGLSHGWVARAMAAEAPECRRVVSLHLSGGASACALVDGASVDTTMGVTPLDGLMMGTRSGAVDPGLLLHALDQGMSPEDLSEMLWHRSGLKGVSGISADLRDILRAGGERAEAAVALYCRHAAKAAAEMAVSAGGIDALVFTGGAGAKQPRIRERVVGELAFFDLSLDAEKNERDAATIFPPGSAVQVRVIPAEEERMMAAHATQLLEESI